MSKTLCCITIGAVFLLTACVNLPAQSIDHKTMVIYHGWSFSVVIPHQMTVDKKTPVHDFDIYTFTYGSNGSTDHLNAYAGNHPDLKNTRNNPHSKTIKTNDIEMIWGTTKTDSGLYKTHVLIDLNQDFPKYIHFWYETPHAPVKEKFDNIIKSVRSVPN